MIAWILKNSTTFVHLISFLQTFHDILARILKHNWRKILGRINTINNWSNFRFLFRCLLIRHLPCYSYIQSSPVKVLVKHVKWKFPLFHSCFFEQSTNFVVFLKAIFANLPLIYFLLKNINRNSFSSCRMLTSSWKKKNWRRKHNLLPCQQLLI
jgi:hypothetical protein